MQDKQIEALRAAINALESQRTTLGDEVLELATAPLRARLAALLRPARLQHRHVTVLFADVVGSTAMAQNLAAEDTLAVLSAALHRMAAVVEAHQGRVLRFTGDGLKAAFGMDETREDDAERAVRAGLAILQAGREKAEAAARQHGIVDFAVRVGVHSGDVALGAGVEADNTAMGAAVNIAARMEQSAPPGGLRISQDTWSQVRGLFELEPQAPLQVKGVDAPMLTYLVHTARERSVASIERGLQGTATPMVGRQAELQQLLDAARQVRQSRQLQATTLLGDAGLGKSRLLREFKAVLSGDGAGCHQLAIRAQPDGQLRPWGLLRSVLAVQCGIADTDSAEVARRKVVDGLRPHFSEHGEREAQLIGQLSGLDFADSPDVRGMDPRALHDQALAAFVAYLQALAAPDRPLLVLLLEDLHWCDDSSLDLLEYLLAHAAQLPMLLVMTARPALLDRRPDWGQLAGDGTASGHMAEHMAVHMKVLLRPLPPAAADDLARTLLQRMAEVPPRLLELLTQRAEGNPYYMEELVRRLIDDGFITTDGVHWELKADRLDTLRLSTTLVGLLQARLDALPAAQRHAARQASVIGHVFWDDALQALDASAAQALPALQLTAYVHENERSDFEGTPERQFDHHLLHQVTYDTLLKAERKLGHAAAARWLSERTRGRGAEFLAMTGEHAEHAGDSALAVDCFEQAGKEAQKRFSNTAAMSWLRRAARLIGESAPRRRFDLLERLDMVADVVGDRDAQDEALTDMAALLERHPDDTCRARMLFRKGLLDERRGDRVAGERHARLAIEMAERCTEAATAARSHILQAWFHEARRDLASALAHLKSARSWAQRVADPDTRNDLERRAETSAVTVLVSLGRCDEARHLVMVNVARFEGSPSVLPRYEALVRWLHLESHLGHFERVAELAERMHGLARSMGSAQRIGSAQHQMAEAKESLGDHAAAIHWYQECLPHCRAAGDRRKEAFTLFGLGRVHADQGNWAAALQWHTQAQDLEGVMPVIDARENLAYVALCRVKLGQADEALAIVNALLQTLSADATQEAADTTIILRWTCQQVLEAMGDGRAMPMLEQLRLDVRARAAAMTDEADRDRLIQALPAWRAIVAACNRPAA